MPTPRGLHRIVTRPHDLNTRQLLGLTQTQFADYLGVSPGRVADNEANRRALVRAASGRGLYLDLLLMPLLATTAPPPPPAPMVGAAPAAVPVAPPPPTALLTAAAIRVLERQHRARAHAAGQLRYTLNKQLVLAHGRAEVNRWRRAMLAAFADPPEAAAAFRAASSDKAPRRTARFQELVADLILLDKMPGGPLDPIALAQEQLRLYLLEAETATLAAWLATAPAPPPA